MYREDGEIRWQHVALIRGAGAWTNITSTSQRGSIRCFLAKVDN